MLIRLERSEFYRGQKHEVGSVIEVGGDLGNRMVRSGRAKEASLDDTDSTVDFPAGKFEMSSDQIDAMSWADQKELASSLGIKTVAVKKSEVVSAIKAHFGVE